jgi:hypothetical protein
LAEGCPLNNSPKSSSAVSSPVSDNRTSTRRNTPRKSRG